MCSRLVDLAFHMCPRGCADGAERRPQLRVGGGQEDAQVETAVQVFGSGLKVSLGINVVILLFFGLLRTEFMVSNFFLRSPELGLEFRV